MPDCPKLSDKVLLFQNETFSLVLCLYFRIGPPLRLIDPFDFELLKRCNGKLGLKKIANQVGLNLSDTKKKLLYWENSSPHFFDKSRESLDKDLADLKYAHKSALNFSQAPDNHHYHVHEITDAKKQFDQVEVTVSHAYHSPHSILGGKSYGEAFLDKIMEDRPLRPGSRFLEIGCGTGLFALNLLERLSKMAPHLYETIQYTMFDLSPALSESQRKICQKHLDKIHFISGNIEDPAMLQDQKFDIIISNEVIADLSVDLAKKENLKRGDASSLAEKMIQKLHLNIEPAPPLFLINTGSIQFLERIKTLLLSGGRAYLTEYGEKNRFPIEVKLGGHNEYSIHFGHLEQVANELGLNPHLESMANFLQFQQDTPVLCKDQYHLISGILLPFLGREMLNVKIHSLELLKAETGDLIHQLSNLQLYTLEEKKDFINPLLFMALTLRMP